MADRIESATFTRPVEAETRMAKVFISYATPDAAWANRVCTALEVADIDCWIAPRDVLPGMLYADGIVRAINESTILTLVLSKSALASGHVEKELERASSKRLAIIALRIDDTPLTPAFEYFLSGSQWIDVAIAGTDGAIVSLVGAVRQHLSRGANKNWNSGSSTPRLSSAAPKRRMWLIAGIGLIITIAAFISVDNVWKHGRVASALSMNFKTSPIPGDKSIAVLPFIDLSEKKDQEYFADGIAEEVLERMAKVPGLKVLGRTSSFQFKGRNTSPVDIGETLGVAYLLEGSVRREDGRIRVTAQLVETQTGTERWSDHFDADVIEVFKVQDTIATEIARALQVTLEHGNVPRASIKSPEALDAYLRGLHSAERSTREGSEAAVADFQRAMSLDPAFAPAAIELSNVYIGIGSEGWLPTPTAFERAREAATLAQRLDPASPAPHVLLATVHVIYDWDWGGADRELSQAFALGPRQTYGVQAAAKLAAARGRWDEARQLGIEAVELDPLNPAPYTILTWNIYTHTGQLAEAEQSARRALQITPGWGAGQYFLGMVLLLQGRHEAALAEFRKETLDDGQLEGSAMAYFAAGRKVESDAALAAAIQRNAASWPSGIARAYSFRGELDSAFEWLDRAFKARDEDLYIIKGDPLFKNLEADPRYKPFLRKMNLAD